MDYKLIIEIVGMVMGVAAFIFALYVATKVNSNKIEAMEEAYKEKFKDMNERIEKGEERHERHDERIRKIENLAASMEEKLKSMNSHLEIIASRIK